MRFEVDIDSFSDLRACQGRWCLWRANGSEKGSAVDRSSGIVDKDSRMSNLAEVISIFLFRLWVLQRSQTYLLDYLLHSIVDFLSFANVTNVPR